MIKSALNKMTDFTGEFPITAKTGAMWRFNESAPDVYNQLADETSHDRKLKISGWTDSTSTTGALLDGKFGKYLRINTSDPAAEKTYLTATNYGTFFNNLGSRIVVGGWFAPTTYSIGATYSLIFNTRGGPGNPLIYISLYNGKPRLMLYNSAGTAILDIDETMPWSFVNNAWYFISVVVNISDKTAQFLVCDRNNRNVFVSPLRSFAGTLNASCTANIVLGMHGDAYWFAGRLDDWFFEIDSDLTIDSLKNYFYNAVCANGADGEADIVAIEKGVVLKPSKNSGILTTIAAECNLAGNGRVAVVATNTAGVTEISLIETSTSDDLIEWTAFQSVGVNGELQSPNKRYIKYRITLTTNDNTTTPKLTEIQLNDIPIPAYTKLGFARPVVLDKASAWENVLKNAFDIIVTSEINGADILEFKIPFGDKSREYLENEKQIQIAEEIYRVRTITDERGSDSGAVTSVYAEAAFYDLTFAAEKQPKEFNAALAQEPLKYALTNTGWAVGNVTVTTKRTWNCEDKNALAILRTTQNIYGGDLVFDSRNKVVNLLTFSGKDSGALFAYKKNLTSIKRVVDTRELVTRLYAVGTNGLTFSAVNGGRSYIENFSYSSEIRTATLDCSNFTNPYQMLEFAKERLGEYAKPRVSYVMSVMDLSVLTGYEHEQWNLGDLVMVDDRELNLTIKTRIIRREYNLKEPWNTVIELSTKLRELGDNDISNAADSLDQSAVLQQEIQNLVPFNLLRNSRGDNGLAYWQSNGFEVDTTNGVSGVASFKATGVLNMTKSISQTVYPANRSNYTISAQIGSDNLQKSSNGQVGIELEFEYSDGSVESRMIDLL